MARSIKEYLYRKRVGSPHRGLSCSLTEDDIQQLLNEAGITIADVGARSDQYVLARHNDTGNYDMGNCRFVTANENVTEMNNRQKGKSKSAEHRRKTSSKKICHTLLVI